MRCLYQVVEMVVEASAIHDYAFVLVQGDLLPCDRERLTMSWEARPGWCPGSHLPTGW